MIDEYNWLNSEIVTIICLAATKMALPDCVTAKLLFLENSHFKLPL